MIATIVFLIASFVWFETVVVDYFMELGITQKFDPVNGLTNHFDYDIWPLLAYGLCSLRERPLGTAGQCNHTRFPFLYALPYTLVS